jgi:hypothetical protein
MSFTTEHVAIIQAVITSTTNEIATKQIQITIQQSLIESEQELIQTYNNTITQLQADIVALENKKEAAEGLLLLINAQ